MTPSLRLATALCVVWLMGAEGGCGVTTGAQGLCENTGGTWNAQAAQGDSACFPPNCGEPLGQACPGGQAYACACPSSAPYWVDGAGCMSASWCTATLQCSDGVDNDRDGFIDLADVGCANGSDSSERDPEVRGVAYSGPRMIPVLIAASDNTDAEIAQFRDLYRSLLVGVRDWYSEKMTAAYGNKTFHYQPVTILRGHYTKAQLEFFGRNGVTWSDGTSTGNGGACSMYYLAEWELGAGGLAAAAGLPKLGASSDYFYYAIHGGGSNGSCGAGGYLGASEASVLLNMARNCPTGRYATSDPLVGTPDCSPVGVIAHEAGHNFGLPHTTDRNPPSELSVMYRWWEFDRPGGATLIDAERADLSRSRWFFAP